MTEQLPLDIPLVREYVVIRHGNQRTLHLADAASQHALCGTVTQYDAKQSLTTRMRPALVPTKWREYRRCRSCGPASLWEDVL